MTIETLSEAIFKRHCDARGVAFRRILEDGGKVADFELILDPRAAIAEIKQLDPNTNDLAREAAMRDGHVGSGYAPTGRLRNLLGSAYRQIKHYSDHGVPALVVCYNNAGSLNNLDNFTVTKAMFGGMAAYIALGADGNIHHVGQGFTGQRKVTRNTLRGLSAVCVLSTPSRDETNLVAYHNPYANNPLSPASLRKLMDKQYGYDDPHAGNNARLLPHEIEV